MHASPVQSRLQSSPGWLTETSATGRASLGVVTDCLVQVRLQALLPRHLLLTGSRHSKFTANKFNPSQPPVCVGVVEGGDHGIDRQTS